MSTRAINRPVEPTDFAYCPDDKTYELVALDLVVRDMSVESSWIAGKILRLLGDHAEGRQIGWVFGADMGCQCFADSPHLVRKPDVTLVRSDRFTVDQIGEGYLRVVPDLVVEVVSPNDSYEEVEEKVARFHAAGVPLIWVVSPSSRTVRVIRSDGTASALRATGELSGEGVVPGFACPVAAIFPPAAKPGPAA